MAEATNFKFGVQLAHNEFYAKNAKLSIRYFIKEVKGKEGRERDNVPCRHFFFSLGFWGKVLGFLFLKVFFSF